jgi:DNA-binding transcriptional ArsR family regulator
MSEEIRQVTDSRVLAAMSHPLRRRLMDVLRVHGPQTVGSLAERTGQAPANVSHHLRVLGECDLIREAPELARDRRERVWRLATRGVRWSVTDFRGDPATEAVVDAARSLNLDHHAGLVRQWFAASADQDDEWVGSAFSTDKWLRLSPAELAELGRDLVAVLTRWAEREVPDDGAERRPIFTFAYGIPATP